MATRGSGRRDPHGDGVHFVTPDGVQVLLEASHDLPLVDISLTLRTGSVHDPPGLEGLARMAARMVRMGTANLDGTAVEESIARLGARLNVETSTSYVRFHGSVIRRNLEPFCDLLADLVRRPAFRAADLAFSKRETLSDIVAARDNDRAIGTRHFRRMLFGDHPYGRSVVGTRASVRALRRAHLAEHHRRHFVGRNLVLGASGDVDEAELRRLVERFFTGLPAGRPPSENVPTPRRPRGRRVLIVDKPDRTQAQIFIGTLGSRVDDPDIYPLMVANTAFGGTFTARLMHEVRSVRGWSYGAYSRLSRDRQRDAWSMWTFPAAKDAIECARLQLELLEDFVREGITAAELRFARKFLINSHCFDVDTAAKRLDARIDAEVFGLPEEFFRDYVKKVRAVTRAEANAAVRRRISQRNLVIVVVASAREVRASLQALPGVQSVEAVRHDDD